MFKTRRHFLLGASATVAALCAPCTVQAQLLGSQVSTLPIPEQTRIMMGTLVSIQVRHESKQAAAEAIDLAFAEATRLEKLLTRHNNSAPLGLLNSQGAISDVPPVLAQVLNLAEHIGKTTQNAFNPLAVTLTEAKRQGASPAELLRLQALADAQGFRHDASGVALSSSELLLSLDGIAKGFIVDAMSQVLRKHGVSNHLINAGGDIYASGGPEEQKPWLVGIVGPQGNMAKVIQLRNKALATSGNSESLLAGYEHILPAQNAKQDTTRPFSASVATTSATMADAYSTALFAVNSMKAQQLATSQGLELVLVS